MAITKIWPVKSHLGELLKYVGNKSKTAMELNPEIMRLIGYDTNEYKTEQRLYVTGVNCTPEGAPELMSNLLKKFDAKTTDSNFRVAYHAVQSFDGRECDPATAHAIGVEYATRLWGENFPIVVATHQNTDNVHNHFAICATGFDGKRFHEDGKMRHTMMDVNDELCRAHGLSVCANRDWGHERNFVENKMQAHGQKSYRNRLREDIDQVIYDLGKETFYMENFWQSLENMGYVVEKRGKYMRVRPDEAERFIRLDSLGERYTEDEIHHRLCGQYFARKEPKQNFVYEKRDRSKGLYGLYLYYQYLLKNLPKTRVEDPAAAITLREDAKKVRMYSDEAIMLEKYKLRTYNDLKKFITDTDEQLKILQGKRQKLRNKLRRMHDSEEMQPMKNEIHILSGQIKEAAYHIKLAKDVEIRTEVTLYVELQFEYEQECKRDPNYAETHNPPEYPKLICSENWLDRMDGYFEKAQEDYDRMETEKEIIRSPQITASKPKIKSQDRGEER